VRGRTLDRPPARRVVTKHRRWPQAITWAQDAPLMTLVRKGAPKREKLGLEPTAGRFAAGQAVTIRPTAGGPMIASHLTMVGRAADPGQ